MDPSTLQPTEQRARILLQIATVYATRIDCEPNCKRIAASERDRSMDDGAFGNFLGSDAARFISAPHKLLVGAEWVDAASGERIPVYDPATGREFATVPAGGAADVDAAVKAARKAFPAWAAMNVYERTKLLWKLADKIEDAATELAEIESLDTGRPIYECKLVDIPGSVNMLRYMAGWSTKINGETMRVGMPGDWHAFTEREPVGVVAIIVPWNYPLELAVWRMAPALAAGCTVILKPAEQTPLSTLRLGQLVEAAGFPPGVVNVVTGYGETAGAALSAHPDVDAISFTGSTEVGKMIVRAATGNLKRVFLELGGKSPAIVFPDADLDRTIPGVAGAIFFSSGQVCTAASRLFVHKDVFDTVMDGVVARARALRVGPGLDPSTELGPVVSAEQLGRVGAFLDQGRKDGVEILTGGKRIGESGYFIEATVIADPDPATSIYRDEIFGPVLCAIPFGDDDLDAIAARANDTIYGLHASVWTRDLRRAHAMARRLKSGNVCINTHNFFDPAFPMGGFRQSGWGRASGFEAIEHYTEVKGVVVGY
jgi:phenylacetaldehyde dehydrogenase